MHLARFALGTAAMAGALALVLGLFPLAAAAQADAAGPGLQQALAAQQTRVDTLEQVLAQVPAEARPAIDRALAQSRADLEDLQDAAQSGEGLDTALARVEEHTQQHLDVLNGLLEEVPAEALPAINHAIAVSQTGRDVAREVLTALRAGERPPLTAFRPTDVRPQGVGRPEGAPASVSRPQLPGPTPNNQVPGGVPPR